MGGIIGQCSPTGGQGLIVNNKVELTSLSGRDGVGGVAGTLSQRCHIIKNSVIGDINGRNNLGGLVGIDNGTDSVIANNYYIGDIIDTFSIGTDIGGLIGETTSLGALSHNYAYGNVTSTNTHIGGAIGNADTLAIKPFQNYASVIVNSFHDTNTNDMYGDTTGTTFVGDIPGSAEYIFNSALTNQGNFTGFDFTNFWNIYGNYPELRANNGLVNDVLIYNLTSSSILADGFTYTIDFLGDTNDNASVTLFYCSHSDTPNCDPLAGNTNTMNDAGATFFYSVTGLSNDAGKTFNIAAVATDVDGAHGILSSQVTLLAANTPNLVTNTGISGAVGSVTTILNTILDTADANSTDDQLLYTLVSIPVNGVLIDALGNILAPSDTFTQDMINSGAIKYIHSDLATTTDSFTFSVQDETVTYAPNATNVSPATVNIALAGGVCANSTATTYNEIPSGDGSGLYLPNAFIICTPTQWNDIATNCNGATVTTCDKSFKLGASIDFNAVTITNTIAEGTAVNFTGNFYGENHAMLNIVNPGASNLTAYRGLFNQVEFSTIDNLFLININYNYTGGHDFIGAIAGKAFESNDFTNIVISGSISSIGSDSVGGLVGVIEGETYLTNVTTNLNISGNNNVGGIIGNVISYNSDQYLDNITSAGIITATGSHIGGVYGYFDETSWGYYRNSVSSVSVSGVNNVGGIIGTIASDSFYEYHNNTLDNVTISCSGSNCGGAFGSISNPSIEIHDISVIDLTLNASGSAETKIGGFIGEVIGDINVYYNSVQNSFINADNNNRVGGFFGEISGSTYSVIDENYVRDTNIECNSKCGGFVGSILNDIAPILGAYVQGGSLTSISGDELGGFAGYIDSDISISYIYTAIPMTYPVPNTLSGAVVGNNITAGNTQTFNSSNFDSDVYGATNAFGTALAGQENAGNIGPLTTAQMGALTNYNNNWPGAGFWIMGATYPGLGFN